MVLLHDPLGGFQDLCRGLGVQGGGVLVQQEKLGFLQGGHQQRQRLALTAGEQANLGGQPVFQAQVQDLQHFPVLFGVRLGNAPAEHTALLAPAGGQCQILDDLHIRGGAGHGVLEHPAQEGRPLVFAQAGDILPVNEDGAGIHGPHPGDGIEHGGFTRAVAADDGTEIPVLQGQIQPLQRLLFVDGAGVEGFVDILDFQHP